MHKTHELRLAKRMARLGTETAFEVLVKAKALEAQGRDIIHLEIGEPDFDTPSNIIEAGCERTAQGLYTLRTFGWYDGIARGHRTTREQRRAGSTWRPTKSSLFPAASPSFFSRFLRLPKMAMKSFTRIPGSRSTSR